MLFSMDFGESAIYGLIDTGSLPSAIWEADLQKSQFLAPQTISNERLTRTSK